MKYYLYKCERYINNKVELSLVTPLSADLILYKEQQDAFPKFKGPIVGRLMIDRNMAADHVHLYND